MRKAKVGVVREHLRRYYNYNEDELDVINIEETKYNSNGDGIIYIAMTDKEDIRDIYRRKAECKRDEVYLKNFTPPQIFKRFVALNKLCSDIRQLDRKLKTQDSEDVIWRC